VKQSEIVIGGVYSNGKCRVRTVIDIGPQYTLYNGQADAKCLMYTVDTGPNKGKSFNMTVQRFAYWAKERLD